MPWPDFVHYIEVLDLVPGSQEVQTPQFLRSGLYYLWLLIDLTLDFLFERAYQFLESHIVYIVCVPLGNFVKLKLFAKFHLIKSYNNLTKNYKGFIILIDEK